LKVMSNVSEPATVNNTIADGPELFAVNTIIQSTYAHYIVFGCAIFACCWAVWCAFLVRKVEMHAEHVRANDNEEDKADAANDDLPWTSEACLE